MACFYLTIIGIVLFLTEMPDVARHTRVGLGWASMNVSIPIAPHTDVLGNISTAVPTYEVTGEWIYKKWCLSFSFWGAVCSTIICKTITTNLQNPFLIFILDYFVSWTMCIWVHRNSHWLYFMPIGLFSGHHSGTKS